MHSLRSGRGGVGKTQTDDGRDRTHSNWMVHYGLLSPPYENYSNVAGLFLTGWCSPKQLNKSLACTTQKKTHHQHTIVDADGHSGRPRR